MVRPNNEVGIPLPVAGVMNAVPRRVEPLLKFTAPVAEAGLIRAISVTFELCGPELRETLIVVIVDLNVLAPTVTVSGDEFEDKLPLSPPYSATNDCTPGMRLLILNAQLLPDMAQDPSLL